MNIILFSVCANAQIEDYLGEWKPSNSDAAVISKVIISKSEGSIFVRVWGPCFNAKNCDWGNRAAARYYPTAISTVVNGISIVHTEKVEQGKFEVANFLVIKMLPNKLLEVRLLITYTNSPVGRIFINSYVKTPDTLLSAPVMISPKADARLTAKDFPFDGNSPKADVILMEEGFPLELKWMPVNGAKSYSVDVEFYDRKTEKWTSHINNRAITETRIGIGFAGNYWGRWRVRAIGSAGMQAETSAWRRFNYEAVKPK